VEGQIFVCKGCCCGNTDRGLPEIPLDEFKTQWKERGIRTRIHLTISGCLGPCAVPNVVMLIYRGTTVWFHSINCAADVIAIYNYVDSLLDATRFRPPTGDLMNKVFQRYETDALVASTAVG
jgi:cobaltochelatase CobN